MSGTWRWPHQENFNCHASDLSFPALSLCSSLVSSPVFRRGDDEYLNISMIDSSGKVCGFRVEDETGSKGRCYSKITLLESLYPIGTFIGCHDWCVSKGIMARVHGMQVELHKLETKAEEGERTSLALIANTKILLPSKGWCVSLCEYNPGDEEGILIAVGSSCGVLLHYLPQRRGNEELLMQSCNVVKTVEGSLFPPHPTVSIKCQGGYIVAADLSGRIGFSSLPERFPLDASVDVAESWIVKAAPDVPSRVTCLALSPDTTMLAIMYWDGGAMMMSHQNDFCWSQFVPDSKDWRQRFGLRRIQHSIEERGGGLAVWSSNRFLALSHPNPPEVLVFDSKGWNCVVKVSCDATGYFHGLTSTTFLPPSLTTMKNSRPPVADTGIVKHGFLALDFTGKLQFIMVPPDDGSSSALLSHIPVEQHIILYQQHEKPQQQQLFPSDHISHSNRMGWKNDIESVIIDSICGSVLVAPHETDDDDSSLKLSPLLCDPINISSETSVVHNHRPCSSSSSLVLDVIMAGCSESGAFVRESSNVDCAVKHKMVTFKVPFLSSRAEVLGGSLQTCSCEGSWEHGGYICLALPDVCYVTYMDKRGKCERWHAIYSPGGPILSVALMHQKSATTIDLSAAGSSSTGLHSDFNCGNENPRGNSIALLLLLADGSLERCPSIDVIASSTDEGNDSRIFADCCRDVRHFPPESLLWNDCFREFPGFCKLVNVVELKPARFPACSSKPRSNQCSNNSGFKVAESGFVCARHKEALHLWEYTGSNNNNVLKLHLWHGCPLQVSLVAKCEAGHVAILQSVMKDSIPGRWWLAGLERKGWKVLDLTLDGDPTNSNISCKNINMCSSSSSLVSLSGNEAMASAVRDFSALLLSNSSNRIYSS